MLEPLVPALSFTFATCHTSIKGKGINGVLLNGAKSEITRPNFIIPTVNNQSIFSLKFANCIMHSKHHCVSSIP